MCVGNCKDPFVAYLKAVGYNTIRLPRANIRPLQLLARSGKELVWMGDATDVFVPGAGVQPPPIESDVPAANVSGQQTGEMSIGVGLSILGNVIGAMGGSKLGLDAAYSSAKSAVFEFTDVLSDSVSVARLDQFLGGSDVSPNSVSVGQMLDADDVYIVTGTIKSRTVVVEGRRSGGVAVTVDVPVVQQIVGGNVKVGTAGGASTRLVYEGRVPLVFGFQAVRLYYDAGAYTAIKPLEPGGMAARALAGRDLAPPDDGAERLATESTFATLRLP